MLSGSRHVKLTRELVRCLGGRSSKKHPSELLPSKPGVFFRLTNKFHYETGVSLDKMISKEECTFLEHISNHPHPTVPLSITDRVHKLAEILPGISVGPKFYDRTVGDTTLIGNEEAAKINNFLHLTPPMVKLHCAELKKLTTPPPQLPLKSMRQFTTNYVYHGPSIKHPSSRDASIKVDINQLELDDETKEYFTEMINSNKHLKLKDIKHYAHFRVPKLFRDLPVTLTLQDSELTITSQQCPTRKQNLSLCYYRLSGFMQEARALKPVTKQLHIEPLFAQFVFDQREENIRKFEEKNFVKINREGGAIVSLTGSAESVGLAEIILLDISCDLVCLEYLVPEPYTHYVKYDSAAIAEILTEQEAIYFVEGNKLVTFSDTIDIVKDLLNKHISTLEKSTAPCEEKIAHFVLDTTFRNTCIQYDSTVRYTEGKFEIIAQSEHQHILTSLLDTKILEVKDTVTTRTIECTQDINWVRIALQFDAHVVAQEDQITVTADPDIVREISNFIKQREVFLEQCYK